MTPCADAGLVINEIMYDQEGADTGYEWVEIYNDSTESISIDSWYFYEDDTHHGLFPDGFSSLSAGSYALIVQDVNLIKSQYGPNIKLIKSSFSLNNTGETINLSDADKNIVDSVSYSSDIGAVGNGYSQQLLDSIWRESAPTPGESNGISSVLISDDSEPAQSSSKSPSSGALKNEIEKDYYTAFIDIGPQAVALSSTKIDAWVSHTKGSKSVKKLSGFYYLNFGDGQSLTTDRRIEQIHTYQYPGVYELVFEYHTSQLAKNSGKEPSILTRKTITVSKAEIAIESIDILSGILIHNKLPHDVNLEGWDLSTPIHSYTFPLYSIIRAGGSIRIPLSVHKLGAIDTDTWILLRNENDQTISSYTNNAYKLKESQNLFPAVVQPLVTHIAEKKEPSVDIKDFQPDILAKYLKQHPEKTEVNFGESHYVGPEEKNKDSSFPVGIIIGTGMFAALLGIIRSYSVSKNQPPQEGEREVIGEIELIE